MQAEEEEKRKTAGEAEKKIEEEKKRKEERFKVQQIEIRLEEIINTTSYFLDRTHDILETLQGRMTWVETSKEPLVDVSPKDLETMKLEYELIEFASKVA